MPPDAFSDFDLKTKMEIIKGSAEFDTEEAKNKVSIKNKGKLANGKNPKAKKVICLTTNEIFTCIKLAAEAYKITPQCITKCCKGKWKSAGKLEDGTKLKWEYLEEEI